ncbi:hypothetical protein H7J06_02100 [Mycobacterium hodleri]|uniref:hypothetical protein n=1 Tax=Mycolicibacterium hodleri TaxID=49897 RepID=UPI0021F2CAAD|nr:hypothetical protein [Mycolicibacterium hodleri]MCV7131766.1 hypothetical protein [Mycolicibacterium hodleri]
MRKASPAIAVALLAAACSSPAPTPIKLAPTTTAHRSTSMVCRIDQVDDRGRAATYYLFVRSADFDFGPCASGDSMPDGPPALIEGLTQRCMYSPTTDRTVHSIVYVSSTDKPANVSAAEALCVAHHGV